MVQSEKCEIIWSARANSPRRQKNTALKFIINSVTIVLYQVYVYPQEILRSQMSVYKPVQNYNCQESDMCLGSIWISPHGVGCPQCCLSRNVIKTEILDSSNMFYLVMIPRARWLSRQWMLHSINMFCLLPKPKFFIVEEEGQTRAQRQLPQQ